MVASFLAQNELAWQGHPLYLLAIGKAAGAMAAGAMQVFSDQLVAGLVIIKHGYKSWVSHPNVQVLSAGHPVSDEASMLAGEALLDFVRCLPENGKLLVLLSGGASAMVEVLPEGLSLLSWQEMTQEWLSSGRSITWINQQRKAYSLIKGGKLLSAMPATTQVLQLVMSDVEGDDLSSIGSGLFYANPAPIHLDTHVLANNALWLAACRQHLPDCQLDAHFQHAMLDQFVERLLLQSNQLGCYIYGGELVMALPEQVGVGGRLQHLALSVAWRMRASRQSWQFIALASDGSDGPTESAGAMVDHTTIAQAQRLGLDVEDYLRRYDAGSCLAELGALLDTGDTGCNLNDLMLFQVTERMH